MARLDVRMDARWAGATEDYTSEAVLVAVSVTDHDGAPVTGLLRGAFRARYQFDPESSVPAGLYDFREILQNPNVRGIYTFLLAPGGGRIPASLTKMSFSFSCLSATPGIAVNPFVWLAITVFRAQAPSD